MYGPEETQGACIVKGVRLTVKFPCHTLTEIITSYYCQKILKNSVFLINIFFLDMLFLLQKKP